MLADLVGTIKSQPQLRRHQQNLQTPVQPQPVIVEEVERPKVYEIRHEISPNQGDGSFRYHSLMSDGLESEQVGHFRNPLQSQVHQGYYTTTDEHGQVVRVDYVADKSMKIDQIEISFKIKL